MNENFLRTYWVFFKKIIPISEIFEIVENRFYSFSSQNYLCFRRDLGVNAREISELMLERSWSWCWRDLGVDAREISELMLERSRSWCGEISELILERSRSWCWRDLGADAGEISELMLDGKTTRSSRKHGKTRK